MTPSGSYIFTLSLLKNLLQESMMLKENLDSSCGTPAIIGPYVYKMQQLIRIKTHCGNYSTKLLWIFGF